MRRDERLEIIAKLITEQEIKTQEELVERLQEHGVDITQATVSRDIKTLALVKMPAQSGGYCYALPENEKTEAAPVFHRDLAFEAITNVKIMDKMLAISANPGTTSLIKNRLLRDFKAELFTAIIDDDSVLAIFESQAAAQKVLELLNEGA